MVSSKTLFNRRVMFVRGVLVWAAVNGQTIMYDRLRRLCRANKEMMGAILNQVRTGRKEGEPDLASLVINSSGEPGYGWREDTNDRAAALERLECHRYWLARSMLDNDEFSEIFGALPTWPKTVSCVRSA